MVFMAYTQRFLLGARVAALLLVVYCTAESFVIQHPVRKKTAGQVRQESTELAGLLLQQLSTTIELQAQIQQALYACITEYAEGDKKGMLAQLQGKELLEYTEQLRAACAYQEQELTRLQRVYTLVQTGILKKH
jgi:hypothetical protein